MEGSNKEVTEDDQNNHMQALSELAHDYATYVDINTENEVYMYKGYFCTCLGLM